jgi:hypothetical protein
MALTDNEVILADGAVSGGKQPTKSMTGAFSVINAHIQSPDVHTIYDPVSQLDPPVAGYYPLPKGSYEFSTEIDWGLNGIETIDSNSAYLLKGLLADQFMTFTGTGPFIKTGTATGVWLQIENLFFNAPNASSVINMANGDSLVLNFVLFENCPKTVIISDTGFLTMDAIAMVTCDDGFTCTNVAVITMDRPQWSSGTNLSGIAFRINGTGLRLNVNGIECETTATEHMFYINPNYTGIVSMPGGTYTNGVGDFFDPTGLNEGSIGFHISVVGAKQTRINGSMTVKNNSTTTSMTQNNWFDLNLNASAVDLTDNDKFVLLDTTTGAIKYLDHEDISAGFEAAISAHGAGSSDRYHFRVVINDGASDTIITEIEPVNDLTSAISATPIKAPVVMKQNENVRIQVMNSTSNSNATIFSMTGGVIA